MRKIILLVFAVLTALISVAQMPSKQEIQNQMAAAIKHINDQISDKEKRIAEAKQNKEDTGSIKQMEDEVTMLKKQVIMMGGVSKSISGMSQKANEVAKKKNEVSVPKKDNSRISSLPRLVLTESQLSGYVKNLHAQVEKRISPSEKKDALDLYNEAKAIHHSVAIAANSGVACWMTGNPEKALYVMGKACSEDMNDADNLNNYASFLIMCGGEHLALPILEYLNAKYPRNSTILNNIGQAWYGLGDIDKSKKYLEDALEIYPGHSMANYTLSKIYLGKADSAGSIAALKASLKESYDPEKEAQLSALGYTVSLKDLPEINLPIKRDPLGFIPLIRSWDPNKIQTSVSDQTPAYDIQDFVQGVKEFQMELEADNKKLDGLIQQRKMKIATDSAFRYDLLMPHNINPLFILAKRTIQLYCFDHGGICQAPKHSWNTGGVASLKSFPRGVYVGWDPALDLFSTEELVEKCRKYWFDSVKAPLAVLRGSLIVSMNAPDNNINCVDYDRKLEAYLAKRKEIYSHGVNFIQDQFISRSAKLSHYIWTKLFSIEDERKKNPDLDSFGVALISDMELEIQRQRIVNYEYDAVLKVLEWDADMESEITSACDKTTKPPHTPVGTNLKQMKVRTLPCEFKKTALEIEPGYYYVFTCNIAFEKKDKRLKTDKKNGHKGSGFSSKRNATGRGPLQSRGPFYATNKQKNEESPAPLNAEESDPSQSYFEYNKWGKLVGVKFQLTEDGTAFADPGTEEPETEYRWSWNAISEPSNGFPSSNELLNKVIIKIP